MWLKRWSKEIAENSVFTHLLLCRFAAIEQKCGCYFPARHPHSSSLFVFGVGPGGNQIKPQSKLPGCRGRGLINCLVCHSCPRSFKGE